MRLAVLLVLLCSSLALAQEAKPQEAKPSGPRPDRVQVSPGVVEAEVGQTIRFSAVAYDANGGQIDAKPSVWFAAPFDVGAADDAGMVTIFAAGELRVGALINGKPGWATVRIKPQQVASVTIKAPAAALVPGAAARLDAQTFTKDGVPREGVEVQWKSESPSVATVDAAGVVTAIAPGRATIRATSGAGTSTAVVAVAANPVGALAVEPRITRARTGDVVRFSAKSGSARSAGRAMVGGRRWRDDRSRWRLRRRASRNLPRDGHPRHARRHGVGRRRVAQRAARPRAGGPHADGRVPDARAVGVRRLPLRDLGAHRQTLGLRHPQPVGADQGRLAQLRRPHPERRQRVG